MKLSYLDCNAGISGNMFVGALLDLGMSEEYFRNELAKLSCSIPEIQISKVKRKGICATLFDVPDVHEHHHRHLSDIIQMLSNSEIHPRVVEDSIRVFSNLAQAEAKIHGISPAEVHFHEVGAIDAIVDIVGACLGLNYFGIQSIIVSPVRVGFGTVSCAHGEIPVPAPATVELLKGIPIFGGEFGGEWATPTGAALLKTFAVESGPLPLLKVEHTGYGAGTRDCPIPNVVRLIIGQGTDRTPGGNLQTVMETNIDDMNPEIYSFLGERLLKTGAKDFFYTPVQMKKGRPGVLLTIIASPEKVPELEAVLFTETTTLGIRKYDVERTCLVRNYVTVTVKDISIAVKTAFYNGNLIKYAPEYEDCLAASQKMELPLREIYEEAIFQARKILQNEGAS